MKPLLTERRALPWACLSIIMLAALLLRLYRIGYESLWWDEYTSHVYLDAPSLFEFLLLNRTLDPLTLPFYYTFEYLWFQYVHDSVYSLRVMSILIGLATLPVVFDLGRRLFDARAGLAAAALLAVSPSHIHHSQSIRMYVVFVFLAAVVIWSFVLLLEKPRFSVWLLHGATSLMLYWTHPFAGLIPAVLGSFLLLRLRRRFVFFVGWTVCQCLLFAPTVAYLTRARFWPEDTTGDWIAPPGVRTFLADVFFDDISAFHWQFRFAPWAENLGGWRLCFDIALACAIMTGLSLMVWRLVSGSPLLRARQREYALLLCIWMALPPLMLFAVSWLVRPCMFPRYTVHTLVAVFLLLGGAVSTSGSRAARILLPGLLVPLLFLQWLWLQPGPQRTDYRSAGLFLHEHVAPEDVVLVESLLWRDVFVHNLKHLTPGLLSAPVAAAETTPLLAAQAVACLGMLPAYAQEGRAGRVWAMVVMDYFIPDPPVAFEEKLAEWDIRYERWKFPSLRDVYIYRLIPPDDRELPADMGALLVQWQHHGDGAESDRDWFDHHAMQAFGDLATNLALHGRSEMSLHILDRIFESRDFAKRIYSNLHKAVAAGEEVSEKAEAIKHLWDAYGFRESHRPAYTRLSLANALALDADHLVVLFEYGLELAAQGDYPGSLERLTRVAEEEEGFQEILASLLKALSEGRGVPEKVDSVNLYREAILAIGRDEEAEAETLLERALELDPDNAAVQIMLGYVLTKRDSYARSSAVLGRYLDMSEGPDVDGFAHMALIHAENDRREEALETLERLFEKTPSARTVYGSLARAIQDNRDAQRAAASIRAYWAGFEARKRGRAEEAAAAFAEAVGLDPHNAVAQIEHGLTLVETKRLEEGLTALRAAAAEDTSFEDMTAPLIKAIEGGSDADAALSAVWSYREALAAIAHNHLDTAETLLQRSLEQAPDFSAAQLMLGYVLAVTDNHTRVEAVLQQYLESSSTPDIDAYAHMAIIQAEQNCPELVIETLRRLFEKTPGAQKIYGSLMRAAAGDGDLTRAAASARALWAGFDARRNGSPAEAQSAFARAVELDENNTLASLELGLAYASTHLRDEALQALNRAAAQDSEYSSMLALLLADLAEGRDVSAALDAVHAYRKGILAQSEGTYAEAVAHLDTAIETDPRLADAHTSRAFALILQRRFDEAFHGLTRYFDEADSPVPGAYGLLAVVHIANGEEEEARKAVQEAVTLDAGYAAQFGPLFRAILEEQNYDAVRAHMDALRQEGLDLYPLIDKIVVDFLRSRETPESAAAEPAGRWDRDMHTFQQEDANSEPVMGGVLFTGSSTARLWDLERDFPNMKTLNRGFGGSCFRDVRHHANSIIGPHRPDMIVLYSGDNDIHGGMTPEQVAADCAAAVEQLRLHAPRSGIIVLAIKLSRARWKDAEAMRAANERIALWAEEQPNLRFVELGDLLLDDSGMPDPECYLADELHLSEEGYRRWSHALTPLLQDIPGGIE